MNKIIVRTVTLLLTQSSQNLVAENFFLVTVVFPSVIVTPRQTWAAEWLVDIMELSCRYYILYILLCRYYGYCRVDIWLPT